MTREQLKAKLPHGSVNKIAQKLGVNRVTVSNWLNGDKENLAIETAVVEFVTDLENRKTALYARLNSNR